MRPISSMLQNGHIGFGPRCLHKSQFSHFDGYQCVLSIYVVPQEVDPFFDDLSCYGPHMFVTYINGILDYS